LPGPFLFLAMRVHLLIQAIGSLDQKGFLRSHRAIELGHWTAGQTPGCVVHMRG
jgi:hypothetical protein